MSWSFLSCSKIEQFQGSKLLGPRGQHSIVEKMNHECLIKKTHSVKKKSIEVHSIDTNLLCVRKKPIANEKSQL